MSQPAVRMLARAELRRAWRNLVVIGLLTGLAGSGAVGALTVARRTETAYPRLEAAARIGDAHGFALVDDLATEIVDLPSVAERWTGRFGVAQLEGTFTFLGVAAGPEGQSEMLQPVLVEGRLPASTGGDIVEIVLRDDFQRETGVTVGTDLPARFLTQADYFSFDTGFAGGEPHGPSLVLRVVGVVRLPGGSATMPPTFAAADALREHAAAFEPGSLWFVRLVEGARTTSSFTDAVDDLIVAQPLPAEASEFAASDLTITSTASEGIDHTADLLRRALLSVAIAIAGAGAVAMAQALHRHQAAGRAAAAVEAALGLSSLQRLAARLMAASLPAAIAAGITASAAVWASRIEPLGAIRNYEPRPGSATNVSLVMAGVIAAAAVVLLLTAATSVLAGRRPSERTPRASWFVSQASRFGSSIAGVTGLRFALEPGRGPRAIPVRSAMAGGAIGVAGVVAGLVFIASLDRLTTSPMRSGVPFDVLVSDVDDDNVDEILQLPDAGTVVVTRSAPVELDGRSVPGYSLDTRRGHLAIQLDEGRLPRTPDEVALGLRLARDLDARVGDTVRAGSSAASTTPLAVVGVGVIPPFNSEELGSNAVLTREGLARAGSADPFSSAAVTARPGSDADALTETLAERFEAGPNPLPPEIDNLRQLGRLPAGVAGAVGLIALFASANAVFMLVRRRRTDLAMLRAFGFTRRQTRSAVLIMAATLASVGVIVGVPVGLAAGALAWRLTAQGAFVATDPIAPSTLVAAVAVGAILVAVLAAVIPALGTGRVSPSRLLRAE